MIGKHLLHKWLIRQGLRFARNDVRQRQQQLAEWQRQLNQAAIGSPEAAHLEAIVRRVAARLREAEDTVRIMEKELDDLEPPLKRQAKRQKRWLFAMEWFGWMLITVILVSILLPNDPAWTFLAIVSWVTYTVTGVWLYIRDDPPTKTILFWPSALRKARFRDLR